MNSGRNKVVDKVNGTLGTTILALYNLIQFLLWGRAAVLLAGVIAASVIAPGGFVSIAALSTYTTCGQGTMCA